MVNLLIDESLPLLFNKQENDYNLKIIDVSCGSGIFISSAFKRLVQRYRIKESDDNNLSQKKKKKEKITIRYNKKNIIRKYFLS